MWESGLVRLEYIFLLVILIGITVNTLPSVFADKKFLEFFFKRVKLNQSGRYEDDFPFVSPCGREINFIRCDDLPVVFTHLLDQNRQVIQDIGKHGVSEVTVSKSQLTEPSSRETGEIQTQLSPSSGELLESQASQSGQRSVLRSPSSCTEWLSYGGAGELLTVPFQPSKLCMLPGGGRVYHAGLEKLGGVGLVKSSLAIELSQFFVYEEGATEHSAPTKFRWRGRTWDLDDSVLRNVMKFTKQCTWCPYGGVDIVSCWVNVSELVCFLYWWL